MYTSEAAYNSVSFMVEGHCIEGLPPPKQDTSQYNYGTTLYISKVADSGATCLVGVCNELIIDKV